MSDQRREEGGVTRLSFLKASAAAAAGAAAIGAPVAAALADDKGKATEPSSSNPREPVMAYVRDAQRGEVTVMSGTSETTYRDKALVKRLLAAAPESTTNGGLNVIAP